MKPGLGLSSPAEPSRLGTPLFTSRAVPASPTRPRRLRAPSHRTPSSLQGPHCSPKALRSGQPPTLVTPLPHRTRGPQHIPPLVADAPRLPPAARLPHGHGPAESLHTGLAAAHQGQLPLRTHVGPGTEDRRQRPGHQEPAGPSPPAHSRWGVEPSGVGSRPRPGPTAGPGSRVWASEEEGPVRGSSRQGPHAAHRGVLILLTPKDRYRCPLEQGTGGPVGTVASTPRSRDSCSRPPRPQPCRPQRWPLSCGCQARGWAGVGSRKDKQSEQE